MSQENVELMVEQFEAANVRDFAAITDAWAEDVTLITHGDLVGLTGVTGRNVVAGKEAVGEWFQDWFRQFARDYRFEIDQVHDLGDRVLVVCDPPRPGTDQRGPRHHSVGLSVHDSRG